MKSRWFPVIALGALLTALGGVTQACGSTSEDEPSARRGTGGSGTDGSGGSGDSNGDGWSPIGGNDAGGGGNTGSGNQSSLGGYATSDRPEEAEPGGLCFLNTCENDDECADCSFGRNTCDPTTNRCVVCDITTGEGCSGDLVCTQYGTCAEEGSVCPPDNTCDTDLDCAACADNLNICHPETKECVACLETDVSACSGAEACNPTTGDCEPKCPPSCETDEDCANCHSENHEALFCNENHKCAGCTETEGCEGQTTCTPSGHCVEHCGATDLARGACRDDDDCQHCGEAVKCVRPINNDVGKCGLPAAGCEAFGKGGLVLPDPWGQVTQLCEDDEGCRGEGIEFDIGKELRELTGLDEFHDAVVPYSMNACVTVSVQLPDIDGGASQDCGVCVPCRVGGADETGGCTPINVDNIVEQLFGPIGGVIAKWALGQIWGDETEHEVVMVCEPLAGEYGVCVPCFSCTASPSTEGSGCTRDWECGYNEYCNDSGECAEYVGDCRTNGCGGDYTCAWNGDGYCCREPFAPNEYSCGTSAECESSYGLSDHICVLNGMSGDQEGFFCVPPDPNCEYKE